MLCARRLLHARAELLCSRAELWLCAELLCPEVLPSSLPLVPSLPQALLCAVVLRAELLCARAELWL